MNYYRILGVNPDADASDIKVAYRLRAKELHPDRNPHDPYAEDLFKRINEAYQVLSHPASRQQHDLMLLRPEPNDDVATVAQAVWYPRALKVKRYRLTLNLSARSLRELPLSHWLLLSALALYMLLKAASLILNVLMLLFLLMQGLLSSFLVQEAMLHVKKNTAFAWITVLMSHAIALLLGFVIWLVCAYLVLLVIMVLSFAWGL